MRTKIGAGPQVNITVLEEILNFLSSEQYPFPDRSDSICYFDIEELLSFVSCKYDLDREDLDSKVNWGTTIGELADLITKLNPKVNLI